MPSWSKEIHIKNEMEATRSGNSNVKELVASIISKLQRINYTEKDSSFFENLNEELESLIFEFQEFHDSSDCENVEEFDCLLNSLYNFGDQVIKDSGNFWNQSKALWIHT